MRDRLGGVPYELKKEKGRTIMRFYPKSESAKNPNGIVFVLSLDKEDSVKLKKILS